MISMLTGVLIDVRAALERGEVDQAVNLVRNWPLRGGWSRVLAASEIAVLKAAGWEGDDK